MCYLRVQHAILSYVHVTHGWAAFLPLSASWARDSRKAKRPDCQRRGKEEREQAWGEMKGESNTGEHVVKCNEVPFVADKIILLAWLASPKGFLSTTNVVDHVVGSPQKNLSLINLGPSKKRPWVFFLFVKYDFIVILSTRQGHAWWLRVRGDGWGIRIFWGSKEHTRECCGRRG